MIPLLLEVQGKLSEVTHNRCLERTVLMKVRFPGFTLTLLPSSVVCSSGWKKAGLEYMGFHRSVGCKYLEMMSGFRDMGGTSRNGDLPGVLK